MVIDHPISGKDIRYLQSRLQLLYPGLVDLDLAMLMNVPPLRITEIKNALPGNATSQTGEDADEGDDTGKRQRRVKPHQAVLTRIILKHPEFTPLVPRPESHEVWEAIGPYMPKPERPSRDEDQANIIGFSPLFGRSSTSSYKVLAEQGAGSREPGTNVVRLYMLVLGKFGKIYREVLEEYLEKHVARDLADEIRREIPYDWRVVRDENHWARYFKSNVRQDFFKEVYYRRRGWFDLYLNVLQDEAISRNIDPQKALMKGGWKNSNDVSEKGMRAFEPRQRPIIGSGSQEFDHFKERFNLSGSELYWVLGVQVKAYFRYKSKERRNKRLDAPTSILLRYLWRQPKDIDLFLPETMSGQDMLDYIRTIEPDFKNTHLGPLLGGAHVVSYHLLEEGMRPLAKRLSAIFAQQIKRRDDFYRILRTCVEEEVLARGLDLDKFWKEGKWNQ